ncbi:Oidioi.mRNA.OKI2018_I69.chr1.g3449.t1.cds [Oikopleura dioica]|uniref:Oidioi.mRNA.OKI2018_I69.chr1.g3449.t1.cds n=1 Tax=Oikopleura dioica TaxID=34765 RepID=A0ABN7T3B3_OIKDI|nr:Oidioi.mRNA.OKI2018_I69.chr1.g3449.t1.cds [Oikopleura dioica]
MTGRDQGDRLPEDLLLGEDHRPGKDIAQEAPDLANAIVEFPPPRAARISQITPGNARQFLAPSRPSLPNAISQH